MHVIVGGCGRVGSGLANELDAEGHTVCVIDHDVRAATLLGAGFRGTFLHGPLVARELLERAGVAEAAALIAVTSSDSANVVAARTAREVYRVPQVVARAYDLRRAGIYADLGIAAVADARWTINEIRGLLRHRDLAPTYAFGGGETLLLRAPLADALAGRPLDSLNLAGAIQIVEVTRGGRSFIPVAGMLGQSGDVVSFAVAVAATDRLRAALAEAPR